MCFMYTNVYAVLFDSIIRIFEALTMDDVDDSEQCCCLRIIRHQLYACVIILYTFSTMNVERDDV